MAIEKVEDEETAVDRRIKYRKLVKGGMSDKEATEAVWPTTTKGYLKNVAEKAGAAAKKKEASAKEQEEEDE